MHLVDLWRERNARSFEDRSRSLQMIKTDCILLLCFWCTKSSLVDAEAILEILESCQACCFCNQIFVCFRKGALTTWFIIQIVTFSKKKFIGPHGLLTPPTIPQMVTQLCILLSESNSTFNFHSKVTQLCTSFSESHSTLNFNSKVTQLSTLSSENHSIY